MMKATRIDDDTWEVLSDSGHTYKVTSTSCTCPNFYIRLKGKGKCKHMIFVQNSITGDTKEIINFIRGRTVTYAELSEKFGDKVQDKLIVLEQRGEILHDTKKDTYMEM